MLPACLQAAASRLSEVLSADIKPVGPATDQADDDPRDFDQMYKDGEL
jgi:hypothetical protein